MSRWILLAGTLLMTSACSSISIVNGVTPRSGYTLTPDVAYGDGPRMKLDVYAPDKADPSGKPAPVVVFFYGGNWREGDRADYRFLAAPLAARGIVVVVPDYRLYPEVEYPEFLKDSAKAVAWTLREVSKYGGDPSNVFVMGHSAGAYNAAMMAYDPRWLGAEKISPGVLAGFVGLAGPYNFLPIQSPDTKPVFDWPNTPASSQPITHVAPTAPHALLIAPGPGKDKIVDPEINTERMADALRKNNIGVEVKRYDSLNHYTTAGAFAWPLRWLAPVLQDVSNFVKLPASTARAVQLESGASR
ncbi:alpha/beta hydrolase [Uliginosibacterium sp. H3]|uniref:Alpha/beta hydrolase n=1 Tax=Uliginosibacterium silvisoli TaxID=3114758 RepID=A0ABU6KAU0_9RHOO|nr:alpha/beta hydrolase [Uliginosibacterium sp. H3]